MKSAIGDQLDELEKRQKNNLEQIRTISENIRKKSDEILELKKKADLNNHDYTKVLKKRIERIDLKISSESLPLAVERDLAKKIAYLESKLKKAAEIEHEKSKSGKPTDEIEKSIKELKLQRDKLKEEVDRANKDINELRRMLGNGKRADSGTLILGEIAIMKKSQRV